ncbi:MAG: hypothetical protein ABIW82_17100 [Dokdonella sp.]
MYTQDAMTEQQQLYVRDPAAWANQTAPKLLRCIVADMSAGEKWESRWIWVQTGACRLLHAATLKLADEPTRKRLWAEESISAKAILLALLPDQVRDRLWREHTSIEARVAIKAQIESMKPTPRSTEQYESGVRQPRLGA